MQDKFDALYTSTQDEIGTLVDGYASGHLASSEFGDRMASLLEDAHTDAAVLGRQHGGDLAPKDDDDRAFGAHVVDGESEYLAQFVKDLESGKYQDEHGNENTDAINNRAGMYVDRLTGTANETWILAQDGDASVTWSLSAQNNCDDCIGLSDGSPYTVDTLPSYPGDGSTECITRCGCFLTNEAGQDGFKRPGEEDE